MIQRKMSTAQRVFIQVDTSEEQENIKNARKSLKVLQKEATNKENLVGRSPHLFKKSKSETAVICSTPSAEPKRRKSSQETAEKLSNKITEDDLTTEGEPSSGYWKALAEKRRIALDISLKENEELHERIASLEEELEISRALTEESKNLVEVLTEMIQEADPANDSGLPNNINGNFSRGNFDTDSLTDETGDETHDEGAITDDNTAHDDHITDGKSE